MSDQSNQPPTGSTRGPANPPNFTVEGVKTPPKSTNPKEGTHLKTQDKKQETTKTMLAVTGQLTLNNNPVDVAVGIDMLDYHRANAEALYRLSTEDDIPTLRDNRRKEHLGENFTHQNKYWSRSFGHIVHAASHRLITSNQGGWSIVHPFVRYTAGYQKEEEPERKVLEVPDEPSLAYQTGVALATFKETPVEVSLWLDRDGVDKPLVGSATVNISKLT